MSLILLVPWMALLSSEEQPTEIRVQSVVISLIDDVEVASPEAGVLSRILVREGALVQDGDLLAELDDSDARLELERVRAELRIASEQATNDLAVQLARKGHGVAEAELLRSIRSNEKFPNAVSSTELDKLQLTRDQTQLQIEHAEHEVKLAGMRVELKTAELHLAQSHLDRRRITSPLSGMVVNVHRQRGEWIQPGESCVRIIRTDQVRAEGFVHISAGQVVVGQPVEVLLRVGEESPKAFEGKLAFVDPEIETVSGQYRVWAEIENAKGWLRPGHRPEMRILPLTEQATSAPLRTTGTPE